jgi:hypothetical protein
VWIVTPCSSEAVQRFGRKYRYCLQVRGVSRARKKHEADSKHKFYLHVLDSEVWENFGFEVRRGHMHLYVHTNDAYFLAYFPKVCFCHFYAFCECSIIYICKAKFYNNAIYRSVSMPTTLRAGRPAFNSRLVQEIPLLLIVQTDTGAHSVAYPRG